MSAAGTRLGVVGRRVTSITAIAAMVMALLTAVGVQSAAAATGGSTFSVCPSGCTFSTIQAAVDTANKAGGDTVVVAAGNYHENVTVDRPVTIVGPQAGVNPAGATPRSGSEAVVDPASGVPFTVKSSGVTINGFTLTPPATTAADAVVMQGAYTGELVENNIINATARALNVNTGDSTITQNLINLTSTSPNGIEANSNPAAGITISKNKFQGATGAAGDITVIGDASSPNSGLTVSGNVAVGPTSGTLVAVFNATGPKITGNTATNEPGSVIYIGGGVTGAQITGNTITGTTANAIRFANGFGDGPNSDATVTDNALSDNGTDVSVAAATTSTDIAYTGTLVATPNYWGSAAGPNTTSLQANGATVTYSPWCTTAACNSTTATAPATRYVGTTNATDGTNDCSVEASPCATIQHAIDVAMPGDIVQVAAGTYKGLVSITKPIDLVGAGAASTVIDGTTLANDTGIVSVGAVSPAGDVSISGFAIKASTTATNSSLGASYVMVLQNTDGAKTITVKDNTLEGVSPAGATDVPNDSLAIVGHTVAGTTSTISGNTFTGVNQGILLENSGPTTITGNTFSKLMKEVDGTQTWPAEGVLVLSDGGNASPPVPQADVTATGNTFTGYAGWGLMTRAGYVLPGCSTDHPCPGSATVTFTGNHFALGGAMSPSKQPTSAIYLEGTLASSVLNATVAGNDGYVTAPGVPIDVERDVSGATVDVTTTSGSSSGNAIITSPDGTTNDLSLGFTPPATVYAIGQPQAFGGFVDNTSTADVPDVRYQVQLSVPAGMKTDQLTLTYSDGSATDTAQFTPEADNPNVWNTFLKAPFTLPHGQFTMDLTISVASGAPAGTVTAKAWLVQVSPASPDTVVNTLAGPVTQSSTIASSSVQQCTTVSPGSALTAADFDMYYNADTTPALDSATRSNGHYLFTDGGIRFWTDGSTQTEPNPYAKETGQTATRNSDKVAGYVVLPTPIPLGSVGTPSWKLTNNIAADGVAGYQLTVENGDSADPIVGNLVQESVYGPSLWWSSTDFKVGAAPGGGSSVSNATLNEYLTRWPNMKVIAYGFSLGSGVHGDNTISSFTIGCTSHDVIPGAMGSISGTVTDSASTPHPLEGVTATATVMGPDGKPLASGSVVTGSDGTYTISGLPASNDYTVSFNPNLVTGTPPTGFSPASDPNAVTVKPGATTTGVDQKMAPLAGIGGTVKTSGGTALAGVTVTATVAGDAAAAGSATTDASGDYTLTNLAPGTYDLTFARAGYNSVTATTNSIAAGAVATVDVSLAQAADSITGAVTDPISGNAVPGVRVTLKDAATLAWVASASTNPTVTDGNGIYSFGSVAAGTYLVCFYAAGDVATCSAAQTLYAGSSLTVNDSITPNPASATVAYPNSHPGWANDPDPAGKTVAPVYVDAASGNGHTGSGALDFTGGPAVDYYHAVDSLPLDQVSELGLQANAAGTPALVYQLRIYGAYESGSTSTVAKDNGFSTLYTTLPATTGWQQLDIDLAKATWVSTRAINGMPTPQTTALTLQQIAQANPQAVVVMYGVFRGSTTGAALTTHALVDAISFDGAVTSFQNVDQPTTHLISRPSATAGWDNDNTAPTYVFGPAGADGAGSLELSVANNTGHVDWFHSVDPTTTAFNVNGTDLPTIPLLGVQGLGFKLDNTAGNPVGFQIRILGANAAGSNTTLAPNGGYAALTWEPAYNQPLPAATDGWISLSQLENGKWWSTRSINGLAADDTTGLTLAEIAIANPNAVIYAYGVTLGSGAGATGATNYVDDVTFDGTTTNFEPDVATFSGTVTGADAKPLGGATVTVKDTTTGDWAVTPGSLVTAADGTYSLTNLPAGTYQLCFVDAGYQAACQTKTVTTPSATTVSAQLSASPASTTVSTPMVPGGWWNDPDGTVAPTYVTVAGALGVGALDLHTTTGATSTDRAISFYHLANPADTEPGPTAAGVPLSQVTEAGLSQNTGTDATYATVYQLRVYGATAASGSGEAANDGWTTLTWFPSTLKSGWNAEPIDLATATWGSSRAINGLGAHYANALTLAQIVAANPGARVVSYGVFRGSTTGGYPDDDSYVDGVSFNGVTTNFEPIVVPAASKDVSTVTAPNGWANDPGGTVAPRYVVPSLSADGDGALNLHVVQKVGDGTGQDPNTYAASYYHAANAADPAAGLPLSQISEMGFQQDATNATYPSVYQLRICADGVDTTGACTGFSTLNWTGDAVTAGTWKTESIDPVTATWWSSRAIGGLAGGESATATLPQIIAANPNAVVMAYGVFRGSTTGNYPTGDGYVDNVSFNAHTTDFEAIALTPSCSAPNAFASLQPSAWDFSQTRANGHYQFLADGGLKIWTDGSSDTGPNGSGGTWNTDKVAGYVALDDVPLADLGQMLLNYTSDGTASATAPGYNLWLDNGVGTAGSNTGGNISGYITNEPTPSLGSGYGDNWWSNTDFQVGAVAGGGSSVSNATLQAYLNRWPHAFVTQYGFSLGSGIHSSGTLNSLSFGCDVNYPMPADSTVTSTPLVTNGWAPDPDGTVAPQFVANDNPPTGLGTGSLDMHVNNKADDGGDANTHAASYYHSAGSVPLTEARSMGYSEDLGSVDPTYRTVYQLRINGATGGGTDGFTTLVWVPTAGTDAGHGWTTYAIDPATAQWVSTRAIAGLAGGQAGPGKTLAQIQAANPNATITAYGVFRGSTDGNYPTGDVDVDGVLFNYTTTNFEPLGSSAANPITSTPSNPNGWAKDPATNVTAPSYVVNPNGVPEAGHTGVGSLDLQLSSATNLTSYFRAANPAHEAAGVPLGDITDMGFNTKTTTGDLPVYQLIVCGSISGDNPAGCDGYTTLVWSPSISTASGWQDVAINPATSQWWSTRALGSLARGTVTTLPQIIATNPNAVVVAYGVFRGSSTATYTSTTDSYVDDVDFNGTVTDFEPDTNAVAGTVTNAITGDPVSGATVTLTLLGGTAPAATETTGTDGTYRAAGLPAGTYTAAFSATGFTGSQVSGVTVSGTTAGSASAALSPAHLPTLDIAVPATILVGASPVTFTGTVDNPVDGVAYGHVRYDITIDGPAGLQAGQVTLEYQSGGTWLPVPLTGTGTITGYFGPQGGFPLPADTTSTTSLRISVASGAPLGAVTVTTDLDGVNPTSHAVIATAATTTGHTQLVTTGSVSGTVTDHATGAGIAGVTVAVMSGSTEVAHTSTASDGTYSVTGVPAGTYSVTFTDAPAYATATVSNVAVQAGTATTGVDAALTANPGGISGMVTDQATGDPISGVAVTVMSGKTEVAHTSTASDGTYSVSGLPAGTYSVGFAVAPTYGSETMTGVDVQAGVTTKGIDQALTANPGSISGTVTDQATGDPISGVTVAVMSGTTTVGHTSTATNGAYTVTGVPAGTYSVEFTDAPTYATSTTTKVAVKAGVPTTGVDAKLTVNPGSIAGTVTDSGSAGVKGVEVTAYGATSGAPVGTSVATAADGTYTIPGVAAGSYVVCFDAAAATGGSSTTGYVSTCSSAQTVSAGKTVTVDQQLAAAPAGASCDTGSLKDVSSFWCKDVTWLLQHKITKGLTSSTYGGANKVTRGQMALFLYRLANPGEADPSCTAPSPFVDVTQGSAACGAITWLVDNHITTGTDATHFSPAASVTRGQMALFLYRETHGGSDAPACGPTTSPFVDVPMKALACGAIAWAFHAGVTNGIDATHFVPAGTVTRYQMAGFLHRAYDLTTLTGTVTTASGPAANVSVVITGTGSTSASYSEVTGSDGTYAVPGIDAGTYTVCFDASQAAGGPWALQCYQAKVGAATPTTVTVTRWNGTAVDATLAAPKS